MFVASLSDSVYLCVFSQREPTRPSLQRGGLGLQPPADGGGLQPVEGAGEQPAEQQRRRSDRNAVVLNHRAEGNKQAFQSKRRLIRPVTSRGGLVAERTASSSQPP